MSRLFAVRRPGEISSPAPWLWALLPFVLAGLSWWVQETGYWGTLTGIGFVILALCLGIGLKVFMAGVHFTRGFILAYISLVLSFIAWVIAGRADPVTEVTIASDMRTPVRISYGDTLLRTLENPGEHQFRRRRFDQTKLRLEVATPDGWTEVTMKTESTTDEIFNDKKTRLKAARSEQNQLREIGLWIDNRNETELELKCGQWSEKIAANEKYPVYLYRRGESVNPALTVNGREAGALTGEYWLLDPTQRRKYVIRTHRYGGVDFLRPGSREQKSGNRLLHMLPGPVDYFFDPAPEKLDVPKETSGQGTIRIEIADQK